MKTLKLITLAAFALLFSQCKTATQATQNSPSILETVQILDSAKSHFIQYVNWDGGNPGKAILLTADWLELQPNVVEAIVLDSTYIRILLKSGLQSYFYFDQVNDSGFSIYRGGGGIPGEAVNNILTDLMDKQRFSPASGGAKNKITNPHVLLFEAGIDHGLDLEGQITRSVDHINNSGLGLDVTVLRGIQCSAGVVETFKDYGLVILDTHGQIDGFLVGSNLDLSSTPLTDVDLKSLIDAQAGAGTSDEVASGNLVLGTSVKGNPSKPDWQKNISKSDLNSFYYPAKRLAQLPNMPNTIIFGNMCFSGFIATSILSLGRTDTLPDGRIHITIGQVKTFDFPIGKTFIDKNPISYYGYTRDQPTGASRQVADTFAIHMEDVLVRRLVKGDSTGIANLQSDNKSEYFWAAPANLPTLGNLFFKHYGADDYSYDTCGGSFTDARDGQIYKTVCIGKQRWMAQNLNYDASGSICNNCGTYGRLYPIKVAMQGADSSSKVPSGVQGVCPKGWHIPSAGEFEQLISTLGGKTIAGGAMKDTSTLWMSPNAGAINSSGFTALPIVGNNQQAYFHTASADPSGSPLVYWLESRSANIVWFGGTFGTNNFSCRCLKDP